MYIYIYSYTYVYIRTHIAYTYIFIHISTYIYTHICTHISGVNLSGVNLRNADLRSAILHNTILHDAILCGALGAREATVELARRKEGGGGGGGGIWNDLKVGRAVVMALSDGMRCVTSGAPAASGHSPRTIANRWTSARHVLSRTVACEARALSLQTVILKNMRGPTRCVCVCICEYVYACMYIYICIYTCIFAYMDMRSTRLEPPDCHP